jgi:caffeoyl-CoA O-methyltransferase
MNFLPPEIEAYAGRFTQPESELLGELSRRTQSQVLQPRMLSGHLQGRLLALLSKLVRPSRILEIGTYTGYSALCLAEGLAPGGKLHTIEVNEELEDLIREYVARAGLEDSIVLHLGEAARVIPGLEGPFDLVFIDADKENYSKYFDLVVGRLRPGGLIVADNLLWSGQVLKPEDEMDAETRALAAYAQKVSSDPRVESVLLPVRDGLMVSRRKG